MKERILSLLRKKRQGMSFQGLIRNLQLSPAERHRLKKALMSMETQGLILKIKRKYYAPSRLHVVRGRYSATSRGYGFVIPDDRLLEDIFIPFSDSAGAFDGDQVEAFFRKKGKRGKLEGKILRILGKEKERIIGLYRERMNKPFFLPLENPFAEEAPLIVPDSLLPQPGMIVEVDRETMRLTDVLGMPDERGVDTESVIRRFNLPSSFSDEALDAARNTVIEYSPERQGRVDYTDWTTVTIDGEDAQDFDDAVSVERMRNGHFLLGVHIADVSHYVRAETVLDREAFERGTSVYFPERTLPMLPEELSTNICSLRPNEERLTMSVILEVDREGNVLESKFHPSLIKSQARLTYGSVFRIFEGDEQERERYKKLIPDLLVMKELASILNQKRRKQGSLDFDLTEPELVYKEGNLVSVLLLERNEAHQLIEEFMLAANEAVASFLASQDIPMIFRTHPKPGKEDLNRLREMLEHFDLLLPPAERIKSTDLQDVLDRAEDLPGVKFINLQVLKSMRLASYSEENGGHYGLAKDIYTHFTSPIRRYPDLLIHRILKSALRGDNPGTSDLSSVAIHCSQQERKAEEAERELLEWRIFRLLKEKLGEWIEGIIVEISKGGLVVELDGYFVDGLVPFSDLGGDYYVRKSEKTLVGRSTGKRFELGDRVKGTLVSVDPLMRRISLSLVSEHRGENL